MVPYMAYLQAPQVALRAAYRSNPSSECPQVDGLPTAEPSTWLYRGETSLTGGYFTLSEGSFGQVDQTCPTPHHAKTRNIASVLLCEVLSQLLPPSSDPQPRGPSTGPDRFRTLPNGILRACKHGTIRG